MKPGYLYVLTHPSESNLYKIGQTTQEPLKRLAQHNSNYDKYAGKIVKETGQKWLLKTYIEVPDPYWAESVFWGSTPLADIPFLGGIEIQHMEWEWVVRGLEAAKRAGKRPHETPLNDWVYSYTKLMRQRLIGRDINLVGYVESWVSGTATFKCCNNHEWKTRVQFVAEGAGCPECGAGEKSPEEMSQIKNLAFLFLLTKPDNPGFGPIKTILSYGSRDEFYEKYSDSNWVVHRSRYVEEGPELSEPIFWELLGLPKPKQGAEVEVDIKVAEYAFRNVIYRLRQRIAAVEKENKINFN